MSLFLVALLAAFTWQEDDKLSVGDKAPALELGEFVKGDPVRQFSPGKVYIVEFWATWCGPCRATIPHLTELQKKNPKIIVIGVNISEPDPSKVEPFVEEMGDKMNYRVARDKQGKMAKNWMGAAGLKGIPASFIVDGDGKIAWIGHPAKIDEPLKEAMSSSSSSSSEADLTKLLGKDAAKVAEELSDLRAIVDSDRATALKKVDEIVAKAPKAGPILAQHVLLKMATEMLGDKKASDDDRKLIVEIAERADKLTKERNAPIATCLAKALHATGENKKAFTVAQRALKLAKGQRNVTLSKEVEQLVKDYKEDAAG